MPDAELAAKVRNVESVETTCSAEANEMLVPNDTSDGIGGAKVASKEGTTKAGLPGWEDAASKDKCGRRLDPMPKRDDVFGPKAWAATSEEESVIATEHLTLSSAKQPHCWSEQLELVWMQTQLSLPGLWWRGNQVTIGQSWKQDKMGGNVC